MSVALGDAGVVACSDIVAAQFIRHAHEFTPLNMTVAQHAGVRRTACHIFIDEILNNAATESVSEIDDVMRKAHLFGIMLGFHDRLDGAAAFLLRQTGLLYTIEGAESDAHHFIALLQEKHGADGGVDAAGHT